MDHVEFWSIKRVIEVVGLSKSEVYRQVREGLFPKANSYRSNNRRFWLSHEVKAWQQAQIDKDVPELRDGLPQDEFEALLAD